MSRSYPLWLKGTTILFGIILLFISLSYGKFILMPLAFSALIAMLLEPLSITLEKWKVPRIAAILLSIVVALSILGGIISLLSIQLIGFAEQLPEANQRIQEVSRDWLQYFQSRFNISPEQQIEYLEQGLSTVVNTSGKFVSTALGTTTEVVTNMALIPLFVFFMMYYKDMFHNFLHQGVFKRKQRKSLDTVVGSIQSVTQNYIIGMITVVTLLTLMNALGLWLIGMEHIFFFAIFAGFLAIIPYIGIILGSLPAIIYAFLFFDSLLMPVGVVGVFAAVQFLEGNFITPNIIGARVSINPFIALVALLIGGEIWGISGMILFVPFIGILKVIFDQIEELKPYGYLLGNTREYDTTGEEIHTDQ